MSKKPPIKGSVIECNGKPDCHCQQCEIDRWGDDQISEYGENNIENFRGAKHG